MVEELGDELCGRIVFLSRKCINVSKKNKKMKKKDKKKKETQGGGEKRNKKKELWSGLIIERCS